MSPVGLSSGRGWRVGIRNKFVEGRVCSVRRSTHGSEASDPQVQRLSPLCLLAFAGHTASRRRAKTGLAHVGRCQRDVHCTSRRARFSPEQQGTGQLRGARLRLEGGIHLDEKFRLREHPGGTGDIEVAEAQPNKISEGTIEASFGDRPDEARKFNKEFFNLLRGIGSDIDAAFVHVEGLRNQQPCGRRREGERLGGDTPKGLKDRITSS